MKLGVDEFERAVAELLADDSEDECAGILRSRPSPVALTSPDRRLEPLEIRSGVGRLRLVGRWQVTAETPIRGEIGRVIIDLTDAELMSGPSSCVSTRDGDS